MEQELLALVLAFVLGLFMRVFGLPPMVGFLLAGFALNAFGIGESETIREVGELGIMLLLFTIGLKLNLRSLIRGHVWKSGFLHVVFTIVIMSLVIVLLGMAGLTAFAGLPLEKVALISFALSFSSTVFAVKVLEEQGEMRSLLGKTAIAILIIQDILSVLFLTIAGGKALSPWALLLLAFPLLRKPLLWLMKKSGHGEMMILYGFLIALASAKIFTLVGLKADLGALVAGLLVANTSKSEELATTLMSFKEFFLVAFFLGIGLSGFPDWWMLGVAVLFVLLLPFKSILYFLLLTRFDLRARTALRISLSLSNYSEFALIVASLAVAQNMLSNDWLIIMSLALTISFFIAAPLNSRLSYSRLEKFLKRFETVDRLVDDQPIETHGADILIFGMSRMGTTAYDYMASKYGKHVLGIDSDYDIVQKHKEEGRRVIIGDATDSGFWDNLRPGNVNLVLLTMHNHSANRLSALKLKHGHYKGKIASIAHWDDEMEELKELGVDMVVNIYDEAGTGFAEKVCEVLGDDGKPIMGPMNEQA